MVGGAALELPNSDSLFGASAGFANWNGVLLPLVGAAGAFPNVNGLPELGTSVFTAEPKLNGEAAGLSFWGVLDVENWNGAPLVGASGFAAAPKLNAGAAGCMSCFFSVLAPKVNPELAVVALLLVAALLGVVVVVAPLLPDVVPEPNVNGVLLGGCLEGVPPKANGAAGAAAFGWSSSALRLPKENDGAVFAGSAGLAPNGVPVSAGFCSAGFAPNENAGALAAGSPAGFAEPPNENAGALVAGSSTGFAAPPNENVGAFAAGSSAFGAAAPNENVGAGFSFFFSGSAGLAPKENDGAGAFDSSVLEAPVPKLNVGVDLAGESLDALVAGAPKENVGAGFESVSVLALSPAPNENVGPDEVDFDSDAVTPKLNVGLLLSFFCEAPELAPPDDPAGSL